MGNSFNEAREKEKGKGSKEDTGSGKGEASGKKKPPMFDPDGNRQAMLDRDARERRRRADRLLRLHERGVGIGGVVPNKAMRGKSDDELKKILGEKPKEGASAEETRKYKIRQMLAETERDRRDRGSQREKDVKTYGNKAYGPSLTVQIGDEQFTHYGKSSGFRQAAATARRINGINANNVSFVGDGGAGDLTGSLRDKYTKTVAEARRAAIDQMLAQAAENADFKKSFGENFETEFGNLKEHEKLAKYATFLNKNLGARPEVMTYQMRKKKWLDDQKAAEADRRIGLVKKANEVNDGGNGAPGPRSPLAGSRDSGVYLNDLLYSERPGFSGVNGQPYKAGDPNGRNVREYARAKAREASERAMYNDMRQRQRAKDLEDSKKMSDYYSANYSAIQRENALARSQQRLWDINARIAQRAADATAFSAAEWQKTNPQEKDKTPATTTGGAA